jgi:hypothetical protein
VRGVLRERQAERDAIAARLDDHRAAVAHASTHKNASPASCNASSTRPEATRRPAPRP